MRLTIGVVALGLALVASGVTPVAASTPVRLAGTTVVVVKSSAYADVVVPRTTWVATPLDARPDLTVASSHEGFSTFALVGRSGSAVGTVLVGGAEGAVPFLLPLPAYPAGAGGDYGARTYGDRTPVPAGTYRLYTGGMPTKLTLRLRDLPGSVVVTPDRRGAVEVARSDVPGGSGNDYTGVGTRHLARAGLVYEVLTVRSDVSAAWQLTMCYRHSRPTVPEATWARGCPDATALNNNVHRFPDVTPTEHPFVQGVVGAPAGDVVQTAWFTAAAQVSSIDYATVWISPY